MTTENKIEALVSLTAGLLASGHYTEKSEPESQSDSPILRKYDTADGHIDWKKEGLPGRYLSHAVADAETLLKEIEFAVIGKKKS